MEPLTPNGSNSHAQTPATPQQGGSPQSITPPVAPIQPAIAEDDEATIEQRWIQKAKEIIAHTKNDPFSQAQLLIELKTEYLAARYGRKSADTKLKP